MAQADDCRRRLLDRLGPWLAVAAALGLRLWHIDLNRFYYDQVWLLRSANDLLDTGRIPMHGGIQLSIGVWLPPLVSYLLAIPSLLSRDPVWISTCMAALDSLGAVFVFRAARQLALSPLAALSAALAYAAAPTGIVFGRMIWNANFVPFLAAAALWGLIDFQVRRRSKSLAIALVAIGWAAQLHLATGVYAVIWVTVAIAGRARVLWLHVASGAAVVIAPMVPYAIFESATGWTDLATLRQFLAAPKHTDLAALDLTAKMAGTAIFRMMLPATRNAPWLNLDPLSWILLGLALCGALFALASRRLTPAMVVAWLVLPIAVSLRHSVDITSWYLLGGVPAIALLQAFALERLGLASKAASNIKFVTPGRIAAPALGLALLAAISVSYAGFQRELASTTREDEYGIPLRYQMAAARDLRAEAAGQPAYFAVPFLAGDTIPYLAGITDYRSFSGRSVVVVPRDESSYTAYADGLAGAFLSDHFGPALTVNTSDGRPEFRMVRIGGERAIVTQPGFTPLQGDVAQGIRLEGYIASGLAAGTASPVQLVWRVTDRTKLASVRFSEFAHVVDNFGKVWSGGADSWDVFELWHDGDLVVWPVDLNISPDAPLGGYWLETGFYDSFGQTPLKTTVNGEPAAPSIRIGPIRVGGAGAAISGGSPMAVFGTNELGLLGARWEGENVTLDWRADAKPSASYTVFVHALDSAGNVVAQQDGIPMNGSYPTDLWAPGDTIHDVHKLGALPKPGLRLEIGLYTQPDVRRTQVVGPAVAGIADHVVIDSPANA